MRHRIMERFVLLPFPAGCVSQSSVAVLGLHQSNKAPKPHPNSSSPSRARKREEKPEEEQEQESLSGDNMKNTFRILELPKPGIHRLFKSIKSFSQLFEYKEETKEEEPEMEIGCPTDVKHVTHIGCDVSATRDDIKGLDILMSCDFQSCSSLHSVAAGQHLINDFS